MKITSIQLFRNVFLTLTLLLTFLLNNPNATNNPPISVNADANNTIKVALLLDTSNSMDGLISQAKSQLWSIVNKLSDARVNDEEVKLEIALYEYGNDNLSAENGYIRRVLPFSTDLDLLSEKLFALKTNGGNEYCGYVIKKAMNELDWEGNDNDLRLIFIAGNEGFDQGNVSYKETAIKAKKKGLVINPIFCGDFEEGIRGYWKEAANITEGEYMSIDQNKKTVYIESPYDDEILKLNEKLNNTYIPYGSKGQSLKLRQETQDENASCYGAANTVKRAVCKSKSVYNNAEWDLVDAVQEKDFELEEVENESLPAHLQKMSEKELKDYIQDKLAERKSIQEEINKLNAKREKHVKSKSKTDENLENALLKSIEKQAAKKGYGC